MKYSNLIKAENVTINNYIPRATGETSARGDWKEINYNRFCNMSVRERAVFVGELAQVHLRTSNAGMSASS